MPVASALQREMRAVGTAVAFLTTLPLGKLVVADGPDLARAGPAFPVVGALLGLAVGGVATALAGPCPPLVAAALALAVATLVTGAIHLDALADTADALGGRSRQEALDIMRDPRTGSFGLVAVVLCLLVEVGALAELVERHALPEIVVAFTLSRAVAPPLASLLPYARNEDGLARPLTSGHHGRASATVLIAAGLSVAVVPDGAPPLLFASLAAIVLAFWLSRARFGGVTGDVLGASIAFTQAACLAVATAS